MNSLSDILDEVDTSEVEALTLQIYQAKQKIEGFLTFLSSHSLDTYERRRMHASMEAMLHYILSKFLNLKKDSLSNNSTSPITVIPLDTFSFRLKKLEKELEELLLSFATHSLNEEEGKKKGFEIQELLVEGLANRLELEQDQKMMKIYEELQSLSTQDFFSVQHVVYKIKSICDGKNLVFTHYDGSSSFYIDPRNNHKNSSGDILYIKGIHLNTKEKIIAFPAQNLLVRLILHDNSFYRVQILQQEENGKPVFVPTEITTR